METLRARFRLLLAPGTIPQAHLLLMTLTDLYPPLCDLGMVSPRLFAAPSLSPGAMYFPVLDTAGLSATAPAAPAASIKKIRNIN